MRFVGFEFSVWGCLCFVFFVVFGWLVWFVGLVCFEFGLLVLIYVDFSYYEVVGLIVWLFVVCCWCLLLDCWFVWWVCFVFGLSLFCVLFGWFGLVVDCVLIWLV